MLLDPDKNMLVNKVTIPEGMITVDIYAKLAEGEQPAAGGLRRGRQGPGRARRRRVAGSPRTRGDSRPVIKSVEGFLFPATYSFQPGLTAKQMLTMMVKQFNKVADETPLHRPRPATTCTSRRTRRSSPRRIAQAEAVNKDDFAKVAQVALQPGLQRQLPVQLPAAWTARSTTGCGCRASRRRPPSTSPPPQLHDANDPYNTHDKAGLPGGAISNPGKDALQGAMTPVGAANVFYFMTIDKQGTMAYATTKAQHDANVALACHNGIPLC